MRSAILAAALLASAASAQTTLNAVAFETGTIQLTGPRPPFNGDNFFNIEGDANGTFASYGVARWDFTQIRADFDTQFGAGNWEVTALRLELTHEPAFFSANGPVDIYYTTDDLTDIKTALSPLVYPFFDMVSGQPDLMLGNAGAPICSYEFINKNQGDIDSYDQNGGPNGPNEALNLVADVKSDIETDNFLTLVFNDASSTVAATYRGQASFMGREGPKLFVTAEATGGGCYADCDGSGTLDLFDFLCFSNAFNNNDPYADCDQSPGQGGVLNLFDFLCFVNAFNAGC